MLASSGRASLGRFLFAASNKPRFASRLLACLLLCGGWNVVLADRFRIDGFVDSNGTSREWADRPRFATPGVVVTSETYVKVAYEGRVSANGDTQLDDVIVLDTFDVVRVELTGNISNTYVRDRQRIVLEGKFTSEDRNLLRRYAIGGSVSNVEQVVATRYGLDGVITSQDSHIQLASIRRSDAPPRKTPLPMDVPEAIDPEDDPGLQSEPESRSAWLDRGRSLLGRLENTLSAYVRSDHMNSRSDSDTDSLLLVTRAFSRLGLEQPRWTLNNQLALEYGEYLDGGERRITNRQLSSDWTWRIAKTDQVSVGGTIRRASERAESEDIIEDFNSATLGVIEQKMLNAYAAWQHGRKEDRYRYDLTAAMVSTSVSDPEDDEFGYDLDERGISGTAYWRVKRRVTVLFDSSFRRFNYAGRDDSAEFSFRPGIEMITSRRLTARALVGYARRQYDEGGGLNEVSWNVDMDWRPTRPTTLSLELARELREAVQRDGAESIGEFGIQQYGRVNWQQRWSQRLVSDVSFAYRALSFTGEADSNETVQVNLGARYRLSPELTISSDGSYTNQRDDFDRWTLTFSADMKL